MPSRNPPIVELVTGVQFTTERPVDSCKLILFWNEFLRANFPDCAEAPTIEEAFEKFGDEISWSPPKFQLRLEQLPQLRYQFSNAKTGRIIQLQSTRLMANWVRRSGEYPRFSAIHAELRQTFQTWQDYAVVNGIGEVVPNQWELCYVNLVPQGELWQSPREWHRVSKIFAAEVDAFYPLELEDRGFQWRMRMPERIGRITLTAMQSRTKDGKPALQLTILARGPAVSIDEAHDRLGLAHTAILELFDRVATEEAKKHWGMSS